MTQTIAFETTATIDQPGRLLLDKQIPAGDAKRVRVIVLMDIESEEPNSLLYLTQRLQRLGLDSDALSAFNSEQLAQILRRDPEPLLELIRSMTREAKQNGLTQEILEAILHEK